MPRVRALDEPLSEARLWTLCGDIAVQDDQLDDAARYYAHAHELLQQEEDDLTNLEVQLKLAMTQLARQQWVEADLDIQQLTLEILGRDGAEPLHAPLYAAQITAHLKRHDIHSAQTALDRCSPELSNPNHHPRAQYHIAQAFLHAAEVAIGLNLRQFALSLLTIAKVQWVSLGSVMHTQVIAQITQEMG